MATAREVGEGLLKPETRKFIKGYAMTLARNRDEAEDLEQETIYRALKGAHLFEAGTNLDAWLATIMRNHFSYTKRRHKASPIDLVQEADYAVELDQDSAIELEKVAEILEGLNKNVAGMLIAKVVDGMPEKEISANFGVPVGTVKSRISRAREVLREKLA